MFKKVDPKPNFPKQEEEILEFWRKNKIFERSIQERDPNKSWTFFDGPPFATGLPHYGHIVPGTIKDIFPRYWTMKGYRVERRAGWDCHGLPVEYEVEKELGISGKKDIEKMGVDKFNETCRNIVLRYTKEWEQTIERMGRWIDFKNAYRTMDPDYMESIWWVFKKIWETGLIYQDYRSVSYCPRCSTPLSNFEVNQGYRDNVEDPSVYVKFKIKDNIYFLVWTTTPWTLPGNVALAVGENIDYIKLKISSEGNDEYFILAEARLSEIKEPYEIVERYKGKDLIGWEYEPLYQFVKPDKKAWYVVEADFVSIEEGTGIVHIAPAYGEEDFDLGKEKNLPIILTIDDRGLMTKETPWEGVFVKDADSKIIEDLTQRGLMYRSEKILHTYPFCWRCESPIYDYIWPSWFIKVTAIKDSLLKNNQKIYWVPAHLKEGRFGKWLEGARDWNISRNRYWGTPIPVWRCQGEKSCNNIKVIGSIKELEELSGQKITDLHKHIVDKITFKCEKCGGEMRRTPEVLDCWFESGAMPYASQHYPFENKEKFEKNFPADFIAEGLDQTRGWFYTLHVLATALFNQPAFKNVVVNGLVLAEDGKKMSKRLKNYPEPEEIINKYGADALRFYLMNSSVVRGEDLCFSEKGVSEVVRLFLTLWNSYSFFVTYANIDGWKPESKIKNQKSEIRNLLDKWILSELNLLIKNEREAMEKYDLVKATNLIKEFIDNLSNWYIRRSRRRFWKTESDEDKKAAYETLYTVLITFSKIIAPILPFLGEEIYLNLSQNEFDSVHLSFYPEADEQLIDLQLIEEMEKVRKIVQLGLAARAKVKIKVRQPLLKLKIKNQKLKIDDELINLIKDELNVKEVEFGEIKKGNDWVIEEEGDLKVALNVKITQELKLEGLAREIVRHIQEMRKEAKFNIDDRISVCYESADKEIQDAFEKFKDFIKQEVLAKKIEKKRQSAEFEKIIKINQKEVWFGIFRL